jgi:HEPN domain-containing protein
MKKHEINNASIVTRYPEDFPTLLKVYPKNVTMKYLKTARDVIQCLKKDRRLRRQLTGVGRN